MLRVASLCCGIGGFDVGFERAGMKTVYQCESDKDANSVLRRHWKHVPKGKDVNEKNTEKILKRIRPDIVCFGSPCQDLSVAGRREGLAGQRSGLFFRCAELAFACFAPWVVFENVPGLFS